MFPVLIAKLFLQLVLLNGKFPRIKTRVVGWAKPCGQFSVKIDEGSETFLVFVRPWDRNTFRIVCVAVLSNYIGEASCDTAVLGQLVSVVSPSVSLVSLVGGPHVLRDTYIELAGSGYREKLVEYPIFDLRLLKRCPQKCASVAFGSFDRFPMTEFSVVRLKGAEHEDWVASRHALRRAVVSVDLSMPTLVEVVGHIVGIWPLIVSFLKETECMTDGDSLAV